MARENCGQSSSVFAGHEWPATEQDGTLLRVRCPRSQAANARLIPAANACACYIACRMTIRSVPRHSWRGETAARVAVRLPAINGRQQNKVVHCCGRDAHVPRRQTAGFPGGKRLAPSGSKCLCVLHCLPHGYPFCSAPFIINCSPTALRVIVFAVCFTN